MSRASSTSVIASKPPKKPGIRLDAKSRVGIAAGGMFVLAWLAAPPARAADEPPLPELLDRVSAQVGRFWDYFSSVACTERVTQTKLGDKGKVLSERRESFDYLIMLRSRGLELTVDESRVETAHTQSKKDASLLETNGFSLFTLIFHNMYQSRYKFQQLPDEPVDGRRLRCLGFQQVSNDHPLSLLHLRDRDYPMAWRGKAWIDPATSAVVRIRAGLGDSMADMGLLRLDADVSYSGIRLNGPETYWLPTRAEVEAQTKRQHWVNTHVFSNYKRFSVDTDVKLGPVN
jgi:hypothetical protein